MTKMTKFLILLGGIAAISAIFVRFTSEKRVSFAIPTVGTETTEFSSYHPGVDFAAESGDVLAAETGIVKSTGFNEEDGNFIEIEHSDEVTTYYSHLGKIEVSQNNEVKKGQKIGELGNTGKSTGPHLHFEVRESNKTVNPSDYL